MARKYHHELFAICLSITPNSLWAVNERETDRVILSQDFPIILHFPLLLTVTIPVWVYNPT